MYLKDRAENFVLVHSEPNPIVAQIRIMNQMNFGEFIMYGTYILGPVKIWEIKYPEGFSITDEKEKEMMQEENNLPFALW
jgi:hypothetical protein